MKRSFALVCLLVLASVCAVAGAFEVGPEVQIAPAGYFPSFSPDGTKIAYSRTDADGFMIFDIPTGTTTVGSSFGGHPSWSPDGSQIAFAAGDLWIMNADGSGAVSTGVRAGRDVAWSPDGRYISTIGSGSWPSQQAYLYDTADGSSRLLDFAIIDEFDRQEVGDVAWTADGQLMITVPRPWDYTGWQPGEIKIFDLNGHETGSIIPDVYTGKAWGPAMSPDGTKLAWGVGYRSIYVANADGSDTQRVTSRGGAVEWSGDSRYITFDDAWSSGADDNGIFYMRVGSEPAVPEPATMLAGLAGLAGIGRYLRKRH